MRFQMTAGQKSDCEGAEVLLRDLPAAKMLIAVRYIPMPHLLLMHFGTWPSILI